MPDLNALIERWQAGDERAAESIYNHCRGSMIFLASGNGRLYAVDLQTGQGKWVFKVKDRVWSSVAVNAGLVYFGSNDQYLYAVDSQTGQERWKFRTLGNVFFAPTVANGVVYFGSDDGYLYALR